MWVKKVGVGTVLLPFFQFPMCHTGRYVLCQFSKMALRFDRLGVRSLSTRSYNFDGRSQNSNGLYLYF